MYKKFNRPRYSMQNICTFSKIRSTCNTRTIVLEQSHLTPSRMHWQHLYQLHLCKDDWHLLSLNICTCRQLIGFLKFDDLELLYEFYPVSNQQGNAQCSSPSSDRPFCLSSRAGSLGLSGLITRSISSEISPASFIPSNTQGSLVKLNFLGD